MNAYEQGIEWKSCPEALEARKALGPDAVQSDWWLVCPRGDWLFWQLDHLDAAEMEVLLPALQRAVNRIVVRAIRQGQRSLRGVRAPWATAWRRWARQWLSDKDRSVAAAKAAWEATATEVQVARAADVRIKR